MTKRIHTFGEKNNKKPKLDDDIEALWGDDIDESVLDDCIKLATQGLDEEKLTCNTLTFKSKIPSYNRFIEPTAKIFSSTQLDSFNITQPGTSKDLQLSNKENHNEDLKKEVIDLRDKYQEKEGEVTILRAQLKESKACFSVEQTKVQNDWKKKLVLTEKQVQSVKSELEFKNLEIANLKQKLIDITIRTTTSPVKTKIDTPKLAKKNLLLPSNEVPHKLHTLKDTRYPLAQFDAGILFNFPRKEKVIFDTKGFQSSRNAIPYLQNRKNSKRICLNQSETYIEIPQILQKLICSSEIELSSLEQICNINKVFILAVKLLEDLYKLLEEIKSNLKTENILEADTTYIRNQINKNYSYSSNENEIGFNAGTIINFLAELLPYNSYINNVIGQNTQLDFYQGVCEEEYVKFGRNISGQLVLTKIISVVKLAGEFRKADMSVFLHSSIKLFLHICKSGHYNSIIEPFCTFVKELIFLRPPHIVVYEITALFKEVSSHTSFIEFILNKSRNCSTTKKGIVYFNTDACRFYIFVLMFEKCLFQFKKIPMDVYLNMACFIYNTFKNSHWVHHENLKECECLPHLYKVILEILFRALMIYKEVKKFNGDCLSNWDYLISNKIITKILALMTFHSYDLTEKYITVLAQYKEIEKYFEEDDDTTILEKLSIVEELPEVPANTFSGVKF